MGGQRQPITVVGIVGDMKRQVLLSETEPAFFIPFSQHPDESVCFVARTALSPGHVLPLMREAILSLDDKLVVKNATTIEALIAASTGHERFRTHLVSLFGVLAAMLAAAGVYGFTTRSVVAQKRELGIRMALGAHKTRLVGTTVWSSLIIGLIGTAAGLIGALWSSRLLSRFLFGIEPSDPATYAIVASVILIVCCAASFAPARRITTVNPVEVLRAD
jgi:ABC-type antimicrobial peptide transport system permease subunit